MKRFANTALRLIKLAGPLAAGMLFQVAFNLVDAYFIGKLGTDAFAAVNLASFSVWLLSAIVGIVGIGANALSAQIMGSRETHRLERIVDQALCYSALLGLLTTITGLTFCQELTAFLTGREEQSQLAATLAAQYLATIFMVAPILCLNETIAALYRGQGDTKTPTLVLSIGFIINAALDPVLIFGWGPFPALGVIGAGLASAFSFFCSLVIFVCIKGEWFQRISQSTSRFAFGELKKILYVGLPPSITNIVFCVVYMLITPYIASLGTHALAALGLGHKVISLSYFLCLSFSLAAITMTGEATGAEDEEEATYRSWVVLTVASATNALVGLCLVWNASDICQIFSHDQRVVQLAVTYLSIVVPSQVLLGAGMSVEGAFAGFGHTARPMTISVLTSLLRWPLVAWVVTKSKLGAWGVWWVFAISTYLRGIGLLTLLVTQRKMNK